MSLPNIPKAIPVLIDMAALRAAAGVLGMPTKGLRVLNISLDSVEAEYIEKDENGVATVRSGELVIHRMVIPVQTEAHNA